MLKKRWTRLGPSVGTGSILAPGLDLLLLGLALSNLCVLLTAIPALMDIAGDMDSRESYAIAFFQVGQCC